MITTIGKNALLKLINLTIASDKKYKQGINSAFNLYSCKSAKNNVQINMLTNCIKNIESMVKLLDVISLINFFTLKVNPQIIKGILM